MKRLMERYRLPRELVRLPAECDWSHSGLLYRFGADIAGFEAYGEKALALTPAGPLGDGANAARGEDRTGQLPLDPDRVLDDLLLERYPAGRERRRRFAAMRALYYGLRPVLPVAIRKHLQRMYLAGWEKIRFPHWPVDCTVERINEAVLAATMRAQGLREIPFIWFWPEGHSSAAIVTHDVETEEGRNYCSALMDVDDAYGVKSSFQIIPEGRYAVLAEMRGRGFEVNVHDLTHDGSLFQNYEQFARQVPAVNRYGQQFGAKGFRAGVMNRNQQWFEALDFEYDMSVPNTAHLEPQRGGCCTVFPYFIGNLVELPLTTTQDYALFNFVRESSLELWERQIDLIRRDYGLISVLVHPDYIQESWAREVYVELLRYLGGLRQRHGVWLARPDEVDGWWRLRNSLEVVRDGKQWRIAGAGSERARLAFACLEGENIVYRLGEAQMAPAAATERSTERIDAGREPSSRPERRPLRVCMLAYTHYEGDNRVMRYAETLAARGDEVDVIALRRADDERNAVVHGVNVLKIQTRVRDEKGKTSYLFRLMSFLLRSARLLEERHRRLHYDLIHVHSVPDFLVLAALLPRLRGAKVILDIHDILPEFYASKFNVSQRSLAFKAMTLVEKFSAWLADDVIIANDLWRERLVKRSVPEAKCATVLNYPDTGIFRRTQAASHDGRLVMLYPGSLNWHQGLDLAIRAFAKICERAPQAEFHIYGQGPDRASLLKLVGELGLEKRVLLRDPLPLREIARVMENADLGVVPKRGDSFGNEAFSTKTLEFMALGVPLIVADTAVDRYYFNDSVVKFFRCGDEDDLAAAMLLLLTSPELRQQLARNGLEFARAYDWENNKDRYLAMVDRLTEKATG
jgi:glycosyltransferase involved in cell wall biosynthesis